MITKKGIPGLLSRQFPAVFGRTVKKTRIKQPCSAEATGTNTEKTHLSIYICLYFFALSIYNAISNFREKLCKHLQTPA